MNELDNTNDGYDDGASLPIHNAAQYGSFEVMKFLHDLNPQAMINCAAYIENNDDGDMVLTSDPDGHNLVHLVLCDHRCDEVAQKKEKFLCAQDPDMLFHRAYRGTPLHRALLSATTTSHHPKLGSAAMIPMVRLLCEIGGGSSLVTIPTVSINAGDSCNGWLPLHYYINHFFGVLNSSLFSEATDLFHLMLQWYPEAAGIVAGTGVEYRKSPYQLAVDKNLDTYYVRLLLRAAPDHNSTELHRLNYAERRMAMFLAFRAVSEASKPLLMSKLRTQSMDLVRHVVSFL